MTDTTANTNTKVKYQYVPRRVMGITNPKHVLYDGKLDGSIDGFSVLRNPNGSFKLTLSEQEKEWLIENLGVSLQDLNTSNRNNPYLSAFKVEMPKTGLRLDVSDPGDFLMDRVLQAYDNIFAPDLSSIKHKASYRYVRVHAEDQIDLDLQASDTKKEFYKALGKLEDSREQMIMYLLNQGRKIHPSIKTKELRAAVNKRAELSPSTFLEAVKDPLFVEKGILNMAVLVNVVDYKQNLYFYESQPLSLEGEPATLLNAATFIKAKKQGQIRVAISKATIDEFNRTKE